MTAQLIAAALALLSALVVAIGTVIRHLVAAEQPLPEEGLSSVKATLTSGKWWAGAGVSVIGYLLQAAALRFASILLVQPITILSLFFALPLSARFTGRRVRIQDWVWAILLTLGVGVLLVIGRTTNTHAHAHPLAWAGLLIIGIAIIILLLRLAKKGLRKERALLIGLGSGITYGYMSFYTKGVVMDLSAGHIVTVFTHPALYLLITASIVGTWLQQEAFNAGAIQQSLPAMTVASPITSSILGIVVYQERFTTPPALYWLVIAAAVLTVVAVIQLSRAEAQDDVA